MDSNSVNGTLDLIGRVVKLGKKATNIQYEEALQVAREAILEQKGTLLSLKEDNNALRKRLSRLEDYKQDLGVYWKSEDTSQSQPYCSVCYAKDRVIPLQKVWEGRDNKQTIWVCPDKQCAATFNPFNYVESTSQNDTDYPTSFFTPSIRY